MSKRIEIRKIIQSQLVRDIRYGHVRVRHRGVRRRYVHGASTASPPAASPGLATIFQELAARSGFSLPVGMQTIVMNAILLLFVIGPERRSYAVQTIMGFVLFGFFTDLFAPFVVPLAGHDLMLPALWGGIISGLGYGLVFRCGVNTGGSDTIAQIISRKTSLPVGVDGHGDRRRRLRRLRPRLLVRERPVRGACRWSLWATWSIWWSTAPTASAPPS